jgi:hypothetical protein
MALEVRAEEQQRQRRTQATIMRHAGASRWMPMSTQTHVPATLYCYYLFREGISRDNVTREMCNVWKSDRLIASIVLSEDMGRMVANIMGWESVRIGQDDLIWKAPVSNNHAESPSSTTTVGFHQDSVYISNQFEPYENSSVTVWMALDDASKETGCVEYVPGSHLWRPLKHRLDEVRTGILTVDIEFDTCAPNR